MAITPNWTQLYVSGNGINGVSVIDTGTNTIEGNSIPAYEGNSLVGTLDGTSVYVNSQGYNTVDVISTATNTVTASIPVNSDLHSLVVSPDSKDVYLYSFPNSGDPSVSVINTVTNTITGNPIAIPGVQATGEVSGLVISPDGHYLYLPNTADGTGIGQVSAIDTTTHTVANTIPITQLQDTIVLSPDGHYAYVTIRLKRASHQYDKRDDQLPVRARTIA